MPTPIDRFRNERHRVHDRLAEADQHQDEHDDALEHDDAHRAGSGQAEPAPVDRLREEGDDGVDAKARGEREGIVRCDAHGDRQHARDERRGRRRRRPGRSRPQPGCCGLRKMM